MVFYHRLRHGGFERMANPKLLELKQRYLNERREFFLEPDRIRLHTKDMDGETETFIDYESITPTTRLITRQNGRLYVAAISFGIFALVGFVLNFAGISALMRWAPLWGVASVILFGFHFYKRRRYFLVDLKNDRSIFFIADRPSKDAVKEFIQSMYESRKKYLRDRYFATNPISEPENELRKFQWLLTEGVISETEFQQMKVFLAAQYANRGEDMRTKGTSLN